MNLVIGIVLTLLGLHRSVRMWQSVHAKQWFHAGLYGTLTALYAGLIFSVIYA